MTTLLVLALLIPEAAGANTQWFYKRQVIAPGKSATVESSTSKKPINAVLKLPRLAAIKLPCFVSGVEAFWNSPTNGLDETRTISFSCEPQPCGDVTVMPILPWTSTLLEGPLPLIDLWEGVTLDLTCGATDYGVFSGNVEAKVGDVDRNATGSKDDLDNVITFRGGVNRPSLAGSNGDRVWFNGFYRLGGKNRGISDEAGT